MAALGFGCGLDAFGADLELHAVDFLGLDVDLLGPLGFDFGVADME